MILGPRIKYYRDILKNSIIIRFTSNIGLYLNASNIVISRAGKTSVTDLEYLGIPSIIIPIRNHFEQKYIAQQETKHFKFIKYIDNIHNIKKLVTQATNLLTYSKNPAPLKYFIGDKIIAKQITRAIMKKYK